MQEGKTCLIRLYTDNESFLNTNMAIAELSNDRYITRVTKNCLIGGACFRTGHLFFLRKAVVSKEAAYFGRNPT